MTLTTDELGLRLAGALPDLAEPDWGDVAARTELFGRASPRPAPRRRRIAPRALVLAILVVLLGGSLALAVGDRVLNVLDDGPAPASVKDVFHQLEKPPYPLDGAPPLPKDYLPGAIIKSSERRVLTIPVGRHATASLYTARTVKGHTCFVTVGGPFRSASCQPAAPAHAPFSLLASQQISSGAPTRVRTPVWTTLGRAASPAATTLRIAYADGAHDDVALSDGWFMYRIPAAHTRPGKQPIRFDVLSEDGARLGSWSHPFLLTPMKLPMSRGVDPLPATVRVLARSELPNDGGTVTISIGRNAAGHSCFRQLRNGKNQDANDWDCRAWVGAYGIAVNTRPGPLRTIPVRWQMGLANDGNHPVGVGYAYAFGWVGPKIVRLDVRFQGGAATEIPLHERYFLWSVPPAHWPAGHRPSILEARAASGRVVYRQFLYPRQHCIYPGPDPACRNFGQGTG